MPRKNAPEDVWEFINKKTSNYCWPCTCYCDKRGYGIIQINGRLERIHRVVWSLINGHIPALFEGLPAMICHSCDNPPCCNPDHLYLGNAKINNQDSAKKGRKPTMNVNLRGSNNPYAKLTEIHVEEIKQFLRESILTQLQIAEKYNITQMAVSCINTGRTWSYLK